MFEDLRRRRVNCTKTLQLPSCSKQRKRTNKCRRCKAERNQREQITESERQRRRWCAKEKERRSRIFAKAYDRRRRGRGGNSDQSDVFEGDIILTRGYMNRVINNIPGCSNKGRGGRATNNVEHMLWPGGLVTYELSMDIQEADRIIIRNALKYLQSKLDSCVRFQETSTGFLSGNKIFVIPDTISSSAVGYQNKLQLLTLGWYAYGVVWHEFLHAIGLHHTQSRPDRDDYLDIRWENVPNDRVQKYYVVFCGYLKTVLCSYNI